MAKPCYTYVYDKNLNVPSPLVSVVYQPYVI